MPDRPYTVLSCCQSLDGYLDDGSQRRLVLSSAEDLDRVDALRASCDAILVGAATIRADDPRLLIRSGARVAQRLATGRPANPTKVTITAVAKLDPAAAFFTAGDVERLVYCADDRLTEAREALGGVARVVAAGTDVRMSAVAADLHARGVRRLLVEGGASVLSQFLREDLADELQVAVAPFFVGDPTAPRFVEEGCYPWTAHRRARLAGTQALGDVVLLHYALSDRFGEHR